MSEKISPVPNNSSESENGERREQCNLKSPRKLNLRKRVELINASENSISATVLAKDFDVSERTVYRILSNKIEIKKKWSEKEKKRKSNDASSESENDERREQCNRKSPRKLNLRKRVELINASENSISATVLAKDFDVSERTVYRILSNKLKLKKKWSEKEKKKKSNYAENNQMRQSAKKEESSATETSEESSGSENDSNRKSPKKLRKRMQKRINASENDVESNQLPKSVDKEGEKFFPPGTAELQEIDNIDSPQDLKEEIELKHASFSYEYVDLKELRNHAISDDN